MVQFKSIFLITILGLIVPFSGCIGQQAGTPTPTLTPTPTVTAAPTVTVTSAIPGATPTGNRTLVRLDSNRGFILDNVTINAGDEIVWDNYYANTVTLVSDDGLFVAQPLDYHQQYRYIFNKPGTYTFHLEQNKTLTGTVIVEAQVTTTTPPVTTNKELPPDTIYVDAQMVKPAFWGINRYELNSLQVQITNQRSDPLSITSQIVNDGQVLEEKTFVLENEGSSYSFANERTHFINNTNVTLRLLIQGYQPVEYNIKEVG